MSISKNRLRTLKQLANKKVRTAMGLFVAEGTKTVGDILLLHKAEVIVGTTQWIAQNKAKIDCDTELIEVDCDELARLSFQQHPQEVFAVFRQPQHKVEPKETSNNLVIALDGIQDPGNLGTIVRIADWFGVANIVCSKGTADIFNPKTVQATMGSIARINIDYVDLPNFIRQMDSDVPVYGTLLDGRNIYKEKLEQRGLIVMGNEGMGISMDVRHLITSPLRIPSFAIGTAGGAESLNVAIATAVTCSEFRRQR